MGGPTVEPMISMWHFQWGAIVIILAFVYIKVSGSLTKKYGQKGDTLSVYHKISFFIGLFFIFLAKGTPLDDIGMKYLFSAHMGEMALEYLIIPPLLLLGIPAWVARKILKVPFIDKMVSSMTKPIIAIILFNLFFSIYHVPFIFDFMANHHPFHNIYNIVMILLSIFMWWPITCPVSEKDHLSELQKMGYIFANSVLLTPACALIIFSGTPLYHFYGQEVPHILPSLSVVEDQQFGGTIMKIVQEIVNGLALGFVFYQWMKKQQEQDKREEKIPVKGYKYLEVSHKTNHAGR
ncbi:cytochrome c oxidase assembly protein [Scopulibacillus cellulosilyticus]|uniref:Cytochrome c oxidase assembly protein n=1 Tax=Scopulibacillus cellulosilyticus TaxID=2665665 RepID=A0ABW2PSN6_9BACL